MILHQQIVTIHQGSLAYPQALQARLGSDAPAEFWAAGPLEPLDQLNTGFFCSSQCPGSIILKTFDAITRMRDEGQVLIGGFHSVMEWECLGILLRGRQPVIWVPARSIVGMHLKPELVPAFNAGRLLILSSSPPKVKRITTTQAEARNRFVGGLADRIFIPHAAPNSRTLALSNELRASRRQILSLADFEIHLPTERTLSSDGSHPQTSTR
jgi:predicted Rossmann fold nucleotide-binding protein DprA/Smf involved in DNA uptake